MTFMLNDGLFPAEIHERAAQDGELAATQLAKEIEWTSCPIRRALLAKKQAQRLRNSAYHRALANRTMSNGTRIQDPNSRSNSGLSQQFMRGNAGTILPDR